MKRVLGFVRLDSGQSMAETALFLPMLVFGLIGGADLARAYALQMAVQNGARAGAESYAVGFAPTYAQTITRTLDELQRTPGMRWNCVIPASPPNANYCHDAAAPGDVIVTVQTASAQPCASPPPIDDPCFVSVEVKYTFRTVVAWPLVPNVANFDRTTTMRTFY